MNGPAVAATAVLPPEPGIGNLVGGRYRIDSELGYGGMARVYRARDERLQRDVAIKVFRSGVAEAVDPQRTTREMHILASLSHPAVVSVLDASDDPVNGAYIVMELVDGDDLGTALHGGALSPEQARRIAGDVAAALAALHERSIVHRDVKPANILVLSAAAAAAGGVAAKLTDFGIAQLIDGTRITAPEQIIGTAAYLSPEQVRSERVGPPSDVYALGLVLLECLTGQRAFPGSGVETAMARLTRPPAIPASVSGPLGDLLRRMTALDPAARPAAEEVATQLRERLVGGMIAGEDVRTAETPALPMAAVAASLPLATGPQRMTGAVPTGAVAFGTGGFAALPVDDDVDRAETSRRRRRLGLLSGLIGGFAALTAAAAVLIALAPGTGATTAPVEQRSGSASPAASAPAASKGASTGTSGDRASGSSTSAGSSGPASSSTAVSSRSASPSSSTSASPSASPTAGPAGTRGTSSASSSPAASPTAGTTSGAASPAPTAGTNGSPSASPTDSASPSSGSSSSSSTSSSPSSSATASDGGSLLDVSNGNG